jgi:hypothetical protein
VGENTMLSQTIRNNLKEDKNKMRSKTTKYSYLFSTRPTVAQTKECNFRQLLKRDGSIKINKNDKLYKELKKREKELKIENSTEKLEDKEDYIVENPNEVIINISDYITKNKGKRLPFFKSISLKLAKIYG